MFVQCLGSGDAFGSHGRCNTSFYIRTRTRGLLLDCGASTLIALKRQNMSIEDIDAVVITHLHGDHFGGLAFLLCEIAALKRRTKPLTIIGPEDMETRTLESLACFYPGVSLESAAEIKFIHYQARIPVSFEHVTITAFPVVHSPETHPHALRIEADGKVVAFSGDTEWTDELVALSQDADLFLCEATELKGHKKYHLSVDEINEKRSTLQTRKIVLTHMGGRSPGTRIFCFLAHGQ